MSQNNGTNISSKVLSDSKSFYNTYVDHKRVLIGFCILLIFIGLVVYLQICGASCSGSDPCGCVGLSADASNGDDDDSNQLNGTAYGWFITISVLFMAIGIGILAYNMAIVRSSEKLAKNGNLSAALLLNGKKDTGLDSDNIIVKKYETAMKEQQLMEQGVNPSDLVKNPEDDKRLVAMYNLGYEDGEDEDGEKDPQAAYDKIMAGQ